MRALDLTEKALKNLKREVTANEKNYKIYLSKLEEARISEDMDRQKIANIGVIQEAFVPSQPINTRKELNIAIGIIIGAISGLGFAFFSEYISQGLSIPESAEIRLNLPVLSSISYFDKNRKTRSTLLRWILGTSTALFLIAVSFWFFPYKNLISSSVDNEGPSRSVHTKRIKLEIQDELPYLEVKSFVAQSKPDALAVQKASLQKIEKLSVLSLRKASIQTDIKNPQWAINISSTTSKRNAINLFTKIKKDGYSVYITEFMHMNKLWYRVRMGFFPTIEDARRIGAGLSEKYSFHDYWIVKVSRNEIIKHKRK
jgi:hypothetical protein